MQISDASDVKTTKFYSKILIDQNKINQFLNN